MCVFVKCFDEVLAMGEEKHGVVNELVGHLCLHVHRHGAADVIKLAPGIVRSLMFGATRTKTHR